MEIMGIIEIRPGEGSVVSDFNVEPFLSMIWPVIPVSYTHLKHHR